MIGKAKARAARANRLAHERGKLKTFGVNRLWILWVVEIYDKDEEAWIYFDGFDTRDQARKCHNWYKRFYNHGDADLSPDLRTEFRIKKFVRLEAARVLLKDET